MPVGPGPGPEACRQTGHASILRRRRTYLTGAAAETVTATTRDPDGGGVQSRGASAGAGRFEARRRGGRLSRRILVVDDDGLVLKSVAKVLSRAGYDVLTAVDVESALRHAEAVAIDAALVDYALSRETGLAVLSHLREVQ